jgi:hypothetical protein
MVQQYHNAVEARQTAEALRNFNIELTQTLDLNSVMEILEKKLTGLVPFDTITLFILQSPHWIVPAASGGPGLETAEPNAINEGLDPQECPVIHRLLEEQKSIAIQDIRGMEGWTHFNGSTQVRSWMGIPLIAGGQISGLCAFGDRQSGRYTPEHARLSEGVVSQAAIAIQNAWLFEQVRLGLSSSGSDLKIVQIQNRAPWPKISVLSRAGGCRGLFQLRLLTKSRPARDPEGQHGRAGRGLTTILAGFTNGLSLRPAGLGSPGLKEAIRQTRSIAEKSGLKTHLRPPA